jgi:hypothetical protein
MKVAVINFSGNVGKSTVSRHMLKPRMNDCEIISIETINSNDHVDAANVKGREFGNVLEVMVLHDDLIVDIGSSNIEALMQQMKHYRGSHEDFDFFIVPTTPDEKQQRDTISTIDALAELGVPPKKIRLLLNLVEADQVPEQVFSGLIELREVDKNFTLNLKALMYKSDIYGKLKGVGLTIEEVLADPSDFKALANALPKTPENQAEKLRLGRMLGVQRLASGIKDELDAAFKALTK